MKDAYEILKLKEADLARVRQEIESLRIVASLLDDDPDSTGPDPTVLITKERTNIPRATLDPTGTERMFSSDVLPRSRFWEALKRVR
jgi:hypothetical protein